MNLSRTLFATVGIVLLLTACKSDAQQKIRLLFLGNSLTYFNNLPELVKSIALSDTVSVSYTTLAFPNYALEDHWVEGNAARAIRTNHYNFVVVQQGPSSQQEGRDMLIRAGLRFNELVNQKNGRLVSFMVWPSEMRLGDFPGVETSYRMLADTTNGIFCEAGLAWQQAWELDPSVELFAPDRFHPGYTGSVLAALMLYARMMNKKDMNAIPYESVKNAQLTEKDFITLKAAVNHILQREAN